MELVIPGSASYLPAVRCWPSGEDLPVPQEAICERPGHGRIGIGLKASSVSLWSEEKVEVTRSLPSAGGRCPRTTLCSVSAVALRPRRGPECRVLREKAGVKLCLELSQTQRATARADTGYGEVGELGTMGRCEDEDCTSPGAFGTAPLRIQDPGGLKEEEGFGLSFLVPGTQEGKGREVGCTESLRVSSWASPTWGE